MCTLSWQIQQDALQLIFNRDELLGRAHARPPSITTRKGQTILSPTDPEGNGSWIAANQSGLIVCLLNNYTAEKPLVTSNSFSSRGLLVPLLAEKNNLFDVRQLLESLTLHLFRPFILTVFQGAAPPAMWVWNGRQLEEKIAPPNVISSSSLSQKTAQFLRFRHYRKLTQNGTATLTEDQQLTMHKSRKPWPPAFAYSMKRKGRATVSITRVRVTNDLIRMDYQSTHPQNMMSKPVISMLKRLPDFRRKTVYPQKTKSIRVDELLLDKNPELYHRFPDFVLRLIKYIVKESEINEFLNQLTTSSSHCFASEVLRHIDVQASVSSLSGKLPPADQRPIFLANHPTGGLDGLLLMAWLLNYYPNLKIIATDLLHKIPHLHPYLLRIDRYNGNKSHLRNVIHALSGDDPLIIFPAGQTARKQRGVLQEAPWNTFPIKKAIRYQRCLVPLHIEGHNSRFFYGLSHVRKWLNISTNLEMLLLPRELLHPACRNYQISIGPILNANPILHKNEQISEVLKELTHWQKCALI